MISKQKWLLALLVGFVIGMLPIPLWLIVILCVSFGLLIALSSKD